MYCIMTFLLQCGQLKLLDKRARLESTSVRTSSSLTRNSCAWSLRGLWWWPAATTGFCLMSSLRRAAWRRRPAALSSACWPKTGLWGF